MSAHQRFLDARAHIRSGDYEAALRDLVWFHNHALEESLALTGVRLSYALDEWARLGTLYPPALAALEQTRDDKAAGLLDGSLDSAAFRDVAAINEYLRATWSTYALYRQLTTAQPALASACASSALPAIVEAGDYPLAAQCMPDPDEAVLWGSARLNRDVASIKRRPYTRAPERWVFLCIYLEDVQLLLTVLAGTGRHAAAAKLKARAIALIRDPSLRREVRAGFVKMPRAPVWE